MPKDRIDLPVLGRAAQLRADSADEAARTVEVVWTTGATVRRRAVLGRRTSTRSCSSRPARCGSTG